ncbi:hypothetical protein EVG20_g4378 [Dentipellis fragilis]|uniref:Uncharacterized protein n=1 Tax=Dentipellis fragilis TaxID=205917 RepID=A0A4Y9YWN1_9AGAM|nr:hypothetical protein EVG20_g4378 [Dentipellis fragilis]
MIICPSLRRLGARATASCQSRGPRVSFRQSKLSPSPESRLLITMPPSSMSAASESMPMTGLGGLLSAEPQASDVSSHVGKAEIYISLTYVGRSITAAASDPPSSASVLPPEILVMRFQECIDPCGLERAVENQIKVPSWVNVLHVCQRWRAAAFGCASPSLWTCVNFENSHWASLFLEYSKLLPLTLDVQYFADPAADEGPRPWGLAAFDPDHVRDLRIIGDDEDDLVDGLCEIDSYAMPIMRRLDLICNDTRRGELSLAGRFQDRMPKLKELLTHNRRKSDLDSYAL